MRSVLVLVALRFILALLMTSIDVYAATNYRCRKASGAVASEKH